MLGLLIKKLTGFDPAAILIGIFLLVIAAVTIPNATKIMNLFGHDSRQQLVDKLKTANDNVNAAAAVNKENEKTVAVLQDTVKNTEVVLDTKVKQDKVAEKQTIAIKDNKAKKIGIIFDQPDKPQDVKDREVSEIQITSIWDSYCSFNSNSQCAVNASPAG